MSESTLAEQVDAVLRNVPERLPSGLSEQSEYAAGIDSASSEADELIEAARGKIAELLQSERTGV